MGIYPLRPTRRYRSIWISDVHLGTRGCQAELLIEFLRRNDCDRLYLVGDIIDGWRLQKNGFWPDTHNDVLQWVLRKASAGTDVVYLPGNHDEIARSWCELRFGGVTIVNEAVHETADGRRFLVVHGDEFDAIVKHARWLAHMGERAYQAATRCNLWLNAARRKLGFPYWSLAAYLKQVVKDALETIDKFERTLAEEARRRGFDGVVCGRVHHAAIRPIDGVLYCNTGDWVENCTALVEDHGGRFEIVRWAEHRAMTLAVAS
ncbi:MAG: UDP-2,3-diacylglucosamine diphosphatase [Alphaproteobacteria bacterium]|nr:UDP-2,3-diacylglucosamine diphosphatase [Alphaproteobacteria bacterium]